MNIETFMQGYKKAWQQRDENLFTALFAKDAEYHNTPFAVQHGHAELAEYWQRVKLQEGVELNYTILSDLGSRGIAHWNVTYQVASEELFEIWARSTGTAVPKREQGDPLPSMILDGMMVADFENNLCKKCQIWWHSMPQPA